jgi:hypothetical protein
MAWSDEPEPYTYAGLNEWVEDKYPHESATAVAKRYSMADLMREHSVITRWLCAPLSDDVRARWLDALDAVCEEIGARFDKWVDR